jgi:hypothetical protein
MSVWRAKFHLSRSMDVVFREGEVPPEPKLI